MPTWRKPAPLKRTRLLLDSTSHSRPNCRFDSSLTTLRGVEGAQRWRRGCSGRLNSERWPSGFSNRREYPLTLYGFWGSGGGWNPQPTPRAAPKESGGVFPRAARGVGLSTKRWLEEG